MTVENKNYPGRFGTGFSGLSFAQIIDKIKELKTDKSFYDAVLFQINKQRALKLDGEYRGSRIPKELTKGRSLSTAFPYRPEKDFPNYYSPDGFPVFIKNTWFPISFLEKDIKTADLAKWGGAAEKIANTINILPNGAKFGLLRNDNFVFVYTYNVFSKSGTLDKVYTVSEFMNLSPKPYEIELPEIGRTGVFSLNPIEELEQLETKEENPFKEERKMKTTTTTTQTPEENTASKPVTSSPTLFGIDKKIIYIVSGIAVLIILFLIFRRK